MSAVALKNLIPLRTFKQPETKYTRRSLLSLEKDYFWQIRSGVVRSYTYFDNETIVVLGLWGIGDIISPLLFKSDTLEMECLTDVSIVPLSLHQQTEINQGLITKTQELQELMVIKHYRPVHEGLMQFLRWLGNKFGQETSNGRLITLRLTHQEIAECLGTTRVTVTRLLTLFEQQGQIHRPSKHSIVLIE